MEMNGISAWRSSILVSRGLKNKKRMEWSGVECNRIKYCINRHFIVKGEHEINKIKTCKVNATHLVGALIVEETFSLYMKTSPIAADGDEEAEEDDGDDECEDGLEALLV